MLGSLLGTILLEHSIITGVSTGLLQLLFQCKYPKEEIGAILPTYSYCKQITPEEFEEQKVSTSQAAVAELLENIIKDKNLSVKDKKRKLKQVRNLVDISSASENASVREGSQLPLVQNTSRLW